MANTRVTFRLDAELIDRGRAYARSRGTTLNDLIRQFLADYAAGRVNSSGVPVGAIPRSRPARKRPGE